MKNQAEIPENEAKEKHQKIWEGMIVEYFNIYLYFLQFFHLEQRAVREAIAHDKQMREMFAELDTNNDSLYVDEFLTIVLLFIFINIEYQLKSYKSIQNLTPTLKMNSPLRKFGYVPGYFR